MNKKYDRKKLDKIVDMIKINRTGVTAQDWFKLAGWILKRWNYENAIQVLPKKEIDLNKLNFNSIGENVYAYLQYHININIQSLKVKQEREQLQESMKIMDKKLGGQEIVKKVEDEWLIKARKELKYKMYLLNLCTLEEDKNNLKQEIQQMKTVVQARKHNIQLMKENKNGKNRQPNPDDSIWEESII